MLKSAAAAVLAASAGKDGHALKKARLYTAQSFVNYLYQAGWNFVCQSAARPRDAEGLIVKDSLPLYQLAGKTNTVYRQLVFFHSAASPFLKVVTAVRAAEEDYMTGRSDVAFNSPTRRKMQEVVHRLLEPVARDVRRVLQQQGASTTSSSGGAAAAGGGAAAAASVASLSAFSAASASRTSLLPAPRSGCCSRSLASSGLGPSSGWASHSPRTASRRQSSAMRGPPAARPQALSSFGRHLADYSGNG